MGDRPDEMTAAIARLNQVVGDVIAAHDGVRTLGPRGVKVLLTQRVSQRRPRRAS